MSTDRPGPPAQLYVIGWPIKHSRSPMIHAYWLAQFGIAGRYDVKAVPVDGLGDFFRAMRGADVTGCNITIPHKVASVAFVDDLTTEAEALGAINTVFKRDGRLVGTNTDGIGFRTSLGEVAPDWVANTGRDVVRPVVVIGAGGAARAIANAMAAGHEVVRIINRTRARADAVKATLDAFHRGQTRFDVVDWEQREHALEDAGLIVNTTSLGMAGEPPLLLSLDRVPGDCLVADIVYSPLETDLLRAARARGLATADGLGMLIHQAAEAFRLWFGADLEPECKTLRIKLEADLNGHA